MSDPRVQVALLTNRLADALQLLERLRGYAEHRGECHFMRTTAAGNVEHMLCVLYGTPEECPGCTCGLATLMADSGAPAPDK